MCNEVISLQQCTARQNTEQLSEMLFLREQCSQGRGGGRGGAQVFPQLQVHGRVSSVQFSCSVVSDSLQPHARLQCPLPTAGVYSNSCPLSRWCHPTISSSVIPFSSCLQSFPASGSFQMSQFFASGGQSVGVSASISVLTMNIQDLFPLGWTGWICLQSKELSRVFSNTTVQKHQFFGAQLSLWFTSHIHTWPLEKPYPWLDRPLLAK